MTGKGADGRGIYPEGKSSYCAAMGPEEPGFRGIAVAAGETKQLDRDRAYGTLRRRVLSGQFGEGDTVAPPDVQEEFGCTSRAATVALHALAADGYLESGKSYFRGPSWTAERLNEHLSQMAVFMEIAGNRVVGDDPERLQRLRRLRLRLDDLDPVSEAHYLTCMEWLHVVLQARERKSFTELISKIVPQCLTRICWIVVEGTRTVEDAMKLFEEALEAEDRSEAGAISYSFWDGLRPLVMDFLSRREREGWSSRRLDATWVLEPNFSGYVPSFGRPGRASDAFVAPYSRLYRPPALPKLMPA